MGAAETGAPIPLQLLVLTTGALALAPMIQFRPQLFDFIALSALLLLLARESYRRAGRLWLAIPIFALWANLHGGFFVGIAVLAAYTAVTALDGLTAGDGLGRAARLGTVVVGCVLATLLNPDGASNWLTVMHTLGNPLTRAMVSEWQSLLFKIAEEWHKSPTTAINFALVIVPFAALVLCFAIRPRGRDLALVVIAAMMGVAAYLAVRNMALTVIASTTPLCRHAALALAPTRFGNKASLAPRKRFHEMLIGAIALATGLFSPSLPDGYPQPRGAVEFMKARGLHGNVLGDFGWGEYLIFHLAPECRVFVDSRYDMVYPQAVLADYLDFFLVHPPAAAVLGAYPHDFVLLRTALTGLRLHDDAARMADRLSRQDRGPVRARRLTGCLPQRRSDRRQRRAESFSVVEAAAWPPASAISRPASKAPALRRRRARLGLCSRRNGSGRGEQRRRCARGW
jgi:hypothetical protein